MKYKGAIFDLDGTLVDSMPVWENLGSNYLKKLRIKPTEDIGETIKTMTLLECAHYFQREHGVTHTIEQIIMGFSNMISRQYEEDILLKPQVRPFLEKLRREGVRCCVLTANERHLAEACLARNDALKYFEFILTCSEVGCGKDNPTVFRQALKRLGTPKEETMVFEDALHAVETAKSAGFHVTGVYDKTAAREEKTIRSIADCYVYTFDEWEAQCK